MEDIENSEALTRIFGTWPSFHDAEVISLRLEREGPDTPLLEAEIHVFGVTGDAAAQGQPNLTRHMLANPSVLPNRGVGAR